MRRDATDPAAAPPGRPAGAVAGRRLLGLRLLSPRGPSRATLPARARRCATAALTVGIFFLAEKTDGEPFTDDEEELLALFASQAAAAVVNARPHRGEQQARADLAALVETSPVGVAVFDAASGRLVSLNREARRIVKSLRPPPALGSPRPLYRRQRPLE